jgi:hypothetical protein
MSDIQIYDDYLPENYFNHLQNILLHKDPNFAWYYNDNVVDENDQDFQFVHVFYKNHVPNSPYFNELSFAIQSLNPLSLIRIKANLLPRTPEHIEHGMHVDVPDSDCSYLKTAILYMNTNNGYTLFEDGTKVNSVANRMVIFPTQMHHTGATCTDEKVRIVINFNYLCQSQFNLPGIQNG